ncbi:MAG: hypothetical protein P4L41_16920 [Flavipsychrobacter sp.]|nr:hypothetical protein [Flavipsychrobacter sp.]
MKKIRFFVVQAAAIILLASASFVKASAQDEGEVSYQTFYDQLSPYGQWVYDPQYGNVWVPDVGSDFRPYGNNGHWVMTDYGNTWVSDYPWGWAPFHYGRWTYSDYYGWTWVPGYEWAPAWVSWRNGGGYYGWAPLSPGLTVSVGYSCPVDWWVFIQPQYMYRPDYYHYWGGARENVNIYNRTTVITHVYVDNRTRTTYFSGPRASEIQAVTHHTVPVYRVNTDSRPGSPSVRGNSLNIYRPAVNRSTIASARPANVVRAPQAIGAARPATAHTGAPAFHAAMQRPGALQHMPVPNSPANSRTISQPARSSQTAPAPVRLTQEQNRAQPQQSRPQPQVNHQQIQPQRIQPQIQQPQRQPQPHSQPVQQQRAQPQMQQNRTQPQVSHQQPQPQQRQQPQMQQPQRQPQMQQPQRMQAPPQEHMQAPPHMEEPHGGGGRR